ncbi:DUF2207 domain-containing protein [Lactobacillus xujianguonis]|uniref:DUF2207 domain-containing protein n=1 Tax=Lactobacillus xujianguonis TaxID=2495899 RepID=A0A437SVQ0_9LACO|nr:MULTISPECIES: DUF2207 domain-containing protein [Lactobacillus]RVU70993.1 DUF2207 domain-containing protein [Lactobacillus xujianguonis]RVU73937.1 DUF2207 domain-containing protein [Lactobacillus xujianguonis]
MFTAILTNAIKNWADTAELNFKIIGYGWDVPLHNVKAEVIFAKPVKGLKAWAHGDLNSYIDVLPRQGKIVLTDKKMADHQDIEVHALFPTSVTELNESSDYRRQDVLDEEKQLADEANRTRHIAEFKSFFAWGISAFFSIWGIYALIRKKKKGAFPKKESELKRNYEIPAVDPVMALVLDKGREFAFPTNDKKFPAFTAYLMYLAGKHKLKIEPFEQGKLHKTTYYWITLLDSSLLNRQQLLGYLFRRIGDGKSFTTYDLKHNSEARHLYDIYLRWLDAGETRAEREGYFDKKCLMINSFFRSLMALP